MGFIPSYKQRKLFFIKVYCYIEVSFNRHAVAVFGTSVWKEVLIFFIIYFHTISTILIPNFQNKTVAYFTKLIFFQLIFFFNYGFCTFLRFIIVLSRNAKRFANAIFFPLLLLLFWDGLAKVFLQTCLTKMESSSLDTPGNYFVYVLKFRMCEHDMPCALEVNSRRAWVYTRVRDSCPSTTTNITSPLPQCLWPLNLAGL